MVAKVNSGKDIRGILNYNENKVTEGVAKCIHENLFGQDVEKLSFNTKLKGFENFINLNRRATTKAVHISLNFHTSEKLSEDKLTGIASTYMDKIGFGQQPYLVYQHFDAAHPHIHIVTTNIQRDGSRIILYNIGRNQSEKARKEIERDFNLVKASGQKQQFTNTSDNPLSKVEYGKAETKRSISNVVRFVVRAYRYTSIAELNAVLSQYNIMADRGSERSQMNVKNGLLYRLIDDNGKKVGVPIKASSIYGKPTMKYLEKQFKLNEALRAPHKELLKKCIDEAFKGKQSVTRAAFEYALGKERIRVRFRKNDEGRVYGITFVDNKIRVVFNGSDLGKAYSAKAITERLTKMDGAAPRGEWLNPSEQDDHAAGGGGLEQLVVDLTHAESFDHTSPDAAMRKRRKKRMRKGKSL
ncbi:MAG TPA: relaxase/mobilization nuclease domain-containing protein [Cyclobacteriaceae bacterium]|nr:relaxase/mobilization nuclease domain-containing protein [Cyclobacteriaceae bacterium]HRF32975.1 relaxase/mobilization nuclease domain-containing protein [Cyclobacteriaceae bacterium]